MQHSLDSFEASLHTLIDSVSSYNPSSAAAVALIAADDEVTAALEQRLLPHVPYPSSES